jgi:hypothetical protein
MMTMNNTNGSGRTGRIKFLFDEEDCVRSYEVFSLLPDLGGYAEPFDVEAQLESDGLDLQDVLLTLRECAQLQPDIEKVTLHYTGFQYSAVVLLSELSDERLSDIYDSFEQACQRYGQHRPLITVIGPEQRDCIMLSVADSIVAYSNACKSNMPATPPLG